MEPCWIFPISSRNYLLASHARRLRARGYVSLTTDNHQLLARDFAAPFLESFKKQISVLLRQGDWWTLSVNALTVSAESFGRRRMRRIFGKIIHSGMLEATTKNSSCLSWYCLHQFCIQRAPAPSKWRIDTLCKISCRSQISLFGRNLDHCPFNLWHSAVYPFSAVQSGSRV